MKPQTAEQRRRPEQSISGTLPGTLGAANGNKPTMGRVTELTTPTTQVSDKYRFDPFGVELPGGKMSPNAYKVLNNLFGYNGEYYDPEAELSYLRNRYYEPETGRFATRDLLPGQLAEPLSMNAYAYVGNNPLKYADPLGLEKVKRYTDPNGDSQNGNIFLDGIQLGLDLAGLIPVIGEPADGLNALIYLGRGDYLNASLSAGAMIPVIGSVGTGGKLVGKGVKAIDKADDAYDAVKGAGKAVNLPSWKKVEIDIDHITSSHMKGGIRAEQSGLKDLFPEYMNSKQIENAVREAYRYGKKVETQGDRLKIIGKSGSINIEMWVNTKTKVIETAYPKY